MFATGPFSVAQFDLQDGSDGLVYRTLRWGYDTLAGAQAQLAVVAADEGLSVEQCTVIQDHGVGHEQEVPPEWEWRQLDAESFAWAEALDVHGAYALGELVRVLVLQKEDPDGADPDDAMAARLDVANPFPSGGNANLWNHYVVYSQRREGMDGFEMIETFNTLEGGKAVIDQDRDSLVHMIRDE